MESDSPLRQSLTNWFLVFCVYTIAAIFFASNFVLQNFVAARPVPLSTILLAQLASSYAWFALTPVIFWLVKCYPLETEGNFLRNLFIHIFGSAGVVLLHLATDAALLPRVGYPPFIPLETFLQAFWFFFYRNLQWTYFVYLVIMGVIYGVGYYQKSRENELRAAQLETLLAQTRLQVLQMQLHPHFLFNTHNAISELIYKNPKLAEKMLMSLSDLLRISFKKLEVQEVPLKQELDFLNKYLEIEQIRFQDRLRVELKVQPETLDVVVPNMILQPLVENAIKHGIAPLARGGTIRIEAARRNGSLQLTVSDNGVGLQTRDASNLVEGVGISNTKARLEHLYPDEHLFEVRLKRNEGLEVFLELPFNVFRTGEFVPERLN
jgi:two-component system, LytTR family, sensor kinase